MIRNAADTDLSTILEIYAGARKFMAEHGNAGQWGTVYPSEEMVRADVVSGRLYVVEREEKLCGVFYFAVEKDETYCVIENGAWKSDAPYGVIHRVAAAAGAKGILRECVEWCQRTIPHLRIDTHRDNTVMQGALARQGFIFCGTIYTKEHSPRMAYELLPECDR